MSRRAVLAVVLALAAAMPVEAQWPAEPARAAAERALARDPADVEARMRLAGLHVAAGDSSAAERTLREGLDVPRIEGRTLALALAELLGARGRFTDGIAVLEGTLADDAAARALRARLALAAGVVEAQAGRGAAAARHWRAATLADPALAEAWTGLVMHAEAEGRRDSAIALVERGLRHAPADARLLAIRASLLPSEAAVAAAVRAIRADRRATPTEANGFALATLLRQQGDGEALLPLLDTLLAAAAPAPDVFRLAATVRRQRGETDQAVALLERAQRLHPRLAEMHADEAQLRHDRREWRPAAQAWLRAIARASDPTPYEFALAETYAASADTGSARAQLRPLADAARAGDVLHRAAVRLRALGDTVAALQAWEARLVRVPDDAAAHIGLAEAWDARGDDARALMHWRLAEPIAASGPWPALALGQRAEDVEEARRWARRALWRGLEALAGAEQRALGALEASGSGDGLARARPDLAERDRLIAALGPLVDSLAADAAWGAAEIDEAERAWRGSPVLRRAKARAAVRAGALAEAARRYDELLALRPDDPALRFEAGAVFARVGRVAEARAAFALALELDPESDAPFRALLAADGSAPALREIETQIRRLRVRLPQSIVLADRLVEVLHRQGRSDEASAAARDLERLRAERGLDPATEDRR